MADISYPVHRLLTNVERPFKSTHIRSIINATHRSDVSMSSLFLCIQLGLRDSHWMVLQLIKVVLKSLSLIHVLVREGSSERVLGYLAGNLDIFNINFRDSSGHPLGAILTPLIKKYAFYLQEKGALFRLTKRDWISQRQESSVMIKTMFEPKDILQESAYLMRLLEAVLACNWEQGDLGHVVTRQAFRIILADIMCLFQLLNECLVVILAQYFAMEKVDARTSIATYKSFAALTKRTQEVFALGRTVAHEIGMDIPKFNAPPESLVGTLEAYVNAPDFEQQRITYKKKQGKGDAPAENRAGAKAQTNAAAKSLLEGFDEPGQFGRPLDQAFDFFPNAATSGQQTQANSKAFATTQLMQQQIDEQIRATDQLLKVSTQNQRVIQPQASNNFQYVPASAQPNQYASAMPDNFAANSTANRTLPQFSNTAAVPSRFPSPQPFAPFQNQTNTGGTLNHSGLQPFPPAQGRNYDAQKNQSTAGFNPFLAAQGESSPAPMVATNATRGAAFNPFSNNGHYQPITPPLQVQSQFTGGYTQPLSGNGNQPPMMQTFATGGSNYSVQTTNPYAPPSPRLAYSNIQAGMTQYPQQQQAFGNQQQPVAQNPFYQNIPKGNQQFNTQQTSIAGSFSDLASSTSKVQHNPFGN